VGLWAGRNVKTLKDYALANKSFGVGVLTMTFLATRIDGRSLMNYPDHFATNGLFYFTATIGAIIALLLFGLYIAPSFVHFPNAITTGDLADDLYGKRSRVVVGIIGTLHNFALITIQILVIGKMSKTLLDFPNLKAIWIGGAIITIYAARGGVRSVAITDVIQFIALVIFVTVIANVVVVKLGGIKILLAKMHNFYPNRFQTLDHPKFGKIVSAALINSFGIYLLSPHYIQRILMTSSPRKIRKMFVTSAAFFTVFRILIMLIGFGALLLYPKIKGENMMPNLISQLFPIGMQGCLIAGVFAVIMSSADSFLNAAGLTLAHDVVQPFLRKRGVRIKELKTVRYATVIIGFTALIAASMAHLLTLNTTTIVRSATVLLTLSFVPLIAGIKGIKTNEPSFFAGLIASALILLLCKFLNRPILETIILSVLANALGFFTSHFIINKGFVTVNRSNQTEKKWNPSWEKLFQWFANYFPTPNNIARYSKYKVDRHGENAFMFSVFLFLQYLFPYKFINSTKQHLYYEVFIIRTISVALCLGLLFKRFTLQKKTIILSPLILG